MKVLPKQMSDDRNLEAIEPLIPIAEEAGISLRHMAMAFVMAHPGVTSAILGPHMMQQFDDPLAGAQVGLSDEIMDRIDGVVAPGTDARPMGAVYAPPSVTQASLRRSPDKVSLIEVLASGPRQALDLYQIANAPIEDLNQCQEALFHQSFHRKVCEFGMSPNAYKQVLERVNAINIASA